MAAESFAFKRRLKLIRIGDGKFVGHECVMVAVGNGLLLVRGMLASHRPR